MLLVVVIIIVVKLMTSVTCCTRFWGILWCRISKLEIENNTDGIIMCWEILNVLGKGCNNEKH